MEQIRIPFHGDGAGVGELTWGQRGLWRAMQRAGTSLAIAAAQPLDPEITVERMVAIMQFMVSRHQSLRTRLRFDGGGEFPRQQVWESGEVQLDVVDAGDADPAALAERIRAEYELILFDYANEWPVKITVIRQGGVLTHLVVCYCHLALDAFGLQALSADVSTMDPATGRSDAPVSGLQPLELARRQAEPAALRQSEASLRYLERLLRRIPAARFGPPVAPQQPRYWEIGYNSPAALLAAQIVAARTGVGTGAVLLAAAAAALAGLTGSDPTVLQVLVSNRFRAGFGTAVTPLTHSSVCVLDVGDSDFDELVRRAARASTAATKNAYYDPVRYEDLIATIGRDRGETIDLNVFYNDRRTSTRQDPPGPVPTPADVRAALPASALRWERRLERFQHNLAISVNDVPGALDWMICADTAYLPPEALQALVHRLESVLVEAAAGVPAAAGAPATGAPAAAGAPAGARPADLG